MTTIATFFLNSLTTNSLLRPNEKFYLVCHDIRARIAFTYAALFSSSILSLLLLHATITGLGPKQPFMLPDDFNVRLWQFSFNRLPKLPEILIQVREKEWLDWLFDKKAMQPDRITPEARVKYVETYSNDGVMSRGFAYYRATGESAKQNRELIKEKGKLRMPILALRGPNEVSAPG